MSKMVATGLLALIAAAGPHMANAEEYHVAVLQSLTGGAAFIGTPFSAGASMAVEDLNAENFLGEGNRLVVEVLDDGTDRTQTLSLMTRLAADGKTLFVLGPTSGAVALSAASIANERELANITVTSSMEVLENGKWSFILTQPAHILGANVVKFAVETMDVQNCAIIGIKDNEAYVELQNVFAADLEARGRKVASIDGVASSDTDFSALATKLAGGSQDCIYISAPAALGANLISQLKQAGLDPAVKIFGHNGFAAPVLIEKGGAAVEGVYLTGDWLPGGGLNDEAKAFFDAFVAKNGHEPDNWHALGYSSMRLVADAIKRAGETPTRASVRDALAASKDVPIIIGKGHYNFVDDRVPSYGSNILTVRDGVFVNAEQ